MNKKKNSVLPDERSCDKDPDRRIDTRIVVINGLQAVQMQDSEYGIEHLAWERACHQIRGSFRQKTSRSIKNGKEYESTRWYQVSCDGSMKSTGSSEEPDYTKYYSPEPRPRYGFTVWISNCLQHDEHIVVDEKDYRENEKLFKDFLVFELDDNLNYLHPLYKNPNKNLSVRVPVAAGSSGRDGNYSVLKAPEISTARKDRSEETDPEFPEEENDED